MTLKNTRKDLFHYRTRPVKVALPTLEGICFERIPDIVRLEAAGNYTRLHFFDGRQFLVCRTLREVEAMLGDRPSFVRIHRSHTVNLDHLTRFVRGKESYVCLDNGARLPVAESRRAGFLSVIERYFAG